MTMKRKVSVIGLLLALLMILGACGGAEDKPNVGAAETPQPTAEPTQQSTGPGVAATGTPAVTKGKLIYYAINPVTGQVIEGEEGAEVVLCANGLVRFVWKDADGNEVSADTVYFIDGEPKTFDLYAQFYGLDGVLKEERKILSWTQTSEDPYFTVVLPEMNKIISELGGGSIAGNELVLTVTDDNGDAVVLGLDGEELIRLTSVDASEVYAYSSSDGSFVSVYRPDSDQTEFYRF